MARHHLGQGADSVCVPHRGNEEQKHVGGGALGAQRPSRASHWYLCTDARVPRRGKAYRLHVLGQGECGNEISADISYHLQKMSINSGSRH
jgi:hypothetical protein